MGWQQSVGFLQYQGSFGQEPFKNRAFFAPLSCRKELKTWIFSKEPEFFKIVR